MISPCAVEAVPGHPCVRPVGHVGPHRVHIESPAEASMLLDWLVLSLRNERSAMDREWRRLRWWRWVLYGCMALNLGASAVSLVGLAG